MREELRSELVPLALLSAASGARTMTGVAAVSRRGPVALLAAAELVADKLPSAPDRIDRGPILARVAAGALIGAMVAGRAGGHRGMAAAIGGLIACASTHATFRLRRALSERMPAVAAALVEDAIVVGAAAAGAALLRREHDARRRRARK
jgi:uncharacterized membrane protein